jgi:hypothetical protein
LVPGKSEYFPEYMSNMPVEYTNRAFGRCKLFGEQEFVTGKITYDYAFYCRMTPEKCGTKGVLFMPKK